VGYRKELGIDIGVIEVLSIVSLSTVPYHEIYMFSSKAAPINAPVHVPPPAAPISAPTHAYIRIAPRRAWLTSPTHADSSYNCICLFCSLNVVCVKIKAAKGLSWLYGWSL